MKILIFTIGVLVFNSFAFAHATIVDLGKCFEVGEFVEGKVEVIYNQHGIEKFAYNLAYKECDLKLVITESDFGRISERKVCVATLRSEMLEQDANAGDRTRFGRTVQDKIQSLNVLACGPLDCAR